jgi:crotonobetainyl-CoA:carnitine CoA-transferase CaiB-like acyl-CoA transferase
MNGPLGGIRVLEMTTAWSGPFAGRILAYLGAEVIHVEAASRLDSFRVGSSAIDPLRYPNLDPGDRRHNRSVMFNSQNHNKLSLCMDVKKPSGADTLRKLAVTCDVILCNFTPGTLARMGLNYDDLRSLKPDIIVLEMPAFGNTGPMAAHNALGPSMEFFCGMASFIGYDDGEPYTTGPAYVDPIGGYNGAAAIMTALVHRQRTGEGQYIEMSQTEAAMPFIGEMILASFENNESPQPNGNWIRTAAPHDVFPCQGSEEWIVIAVMSDEQWRTLCSIIEAPELVEDARFANTESRFLHQRELFEPIVRWTRLQSKHHAAAILQANGILAAPVNNGKDVAESEYLKHRGSFTLLNHPEAGRHAYQSLPLHFANAEVGQHTASPLLGQHTKMILRDMLGYSEEAIAALDKAGTISADPAL